MSANQFIPTVSFPLEEVLESLHIPNDPEGEEYDILNELLAEAVSLARPKALWRESRVEASEKALMLDDVVFSDPLILEKLSGHRVVYPYVITCGDELDNWSKRFTDPLESFIADGIKVFALRQVGSAFHQYMQKEVFGDHVFSAVIPGSLPSWPIQGQVQLFRLLGDVKGGIGVELTPDYLMIPTKSGSGIFFESEEEFHTCERCPRQNCPNRRAPRET